MLFADAKCPQAALSLADLQSMWGSQDTARRASAGDPELTALAPYPRTGPPRHTPCRFIRVRGPQAIQHGRRKGRRQ